MFGSEHWLITMYNHMFITPGSNFIMHNGKTLMPRTEVRGLE
jgi:hypothetical protein